MSTAKATLIGLYNLDNQLFSKMVLPDGINSNLFISSLLLKAGEFEVLFFNPSFMRDAIGVWSAKWYRTFEEWLRGQNEKFNPIYNYDRFESITDEGGKTFGSKTEANYTDTRTANLTEKRTANLTEERTANLQDKSTLNNTDTTSQTTDATTTHTVAGYNEASYLPSSQDKINNGVSSVAHTGSITNNTTGTDKNTTTGTDTNATTGTDKNQRAGTLADTSGSESTNNTHTAHLYGNIGVTTSAAMLKEFYDISSWNLYEHMADIFTQEFLIPVY